MNWKGVLPAVTTNFSASRWRRSRACSIAEVLGGRKPSVDLNLLNPNRFA